MRALDIALALVFALALETGFSPVRQAFSADLDRPVRQGFADIEAIIEYDFAHYDPNYVTTRARYANRLKPLTARLVALQEQGKAMACSEQTGMGLRRRSMSEKTAPTATEIGPHRRHDQNESYELLSYVDSEKTCNKT